MVNLTKLIADIRACVRSPDHAADGALRALAAQYVEVCREVNDRLRQCQDWLQRGLRSEAVASAEMEPRLLDVIGALEFPERAAWEQLVAAAGAGRLIPLDMRLADVLNHAYVVELQVRPLLIEHRRLALARAPLIERIRVMRDIAAIDVLSPFWTADIVEFEKAWFAAASRVARVAADASEFHVVSVILTDYRNEPWLFTPPPEVQQEMQELGRRYTAEKLLPRIVRKMLAACDENDAQQASGLVQTFRGLEKLNWLPELDDETAAVLASVFDWVAQVEQYEAAERAFENDVANIRRAILEEFPEEHLAALERVANRHRRPLPPGIAQLLLACKSDFFWKKVKTRLIAALTVLLMVIILVVLFTAR